MILVLGIGNTVMTDDGAGPRVIQRLRERFSFPRDVELLDGGTLGLDLLPRLEGVKRLIIVDAVETGEPPGSIVRLTGDDIPIAMQTKLSPHQMGLQDLLSVASLQGNLPPETVLWGVQPDSIEMGTELTPEVSAAVERLASAVATEVDWSFVHRD